MTVGGQLIQKERLKRKLKFNDGALILIKAIRINTMSKLTFGDSKKFEFLLNDMFQESKLRILSIKIMKKQSMILWLNSISKIMQSSTARCFNSTKPPDKECELSFLVLLDEERARFGRSYEKHMKGSALPCQSTSWTRRVC